MAVALPKVMVPTLLRLSLTVVSVLLVKLMVLEELRTRSITMLANPCQLIVPNVAPCRTSVVASAVHVGRVTLMPEIRVMAPVPAERLPVRFSLPVPATTPPAA